MHQENRGLGFLLVCCVCMWACCESLRPIVMDKSKIVFDDGDTLEYGELTIRILGIDTPEIAHQQHGLFEDQPFGQDAACRTEQIIRAAGRVEYLPSRLDKYGRTLAHLFVDGELLAIHLLREGLAYETISFYGDNGFPDLAAEILRAAEAGPKPAFGPPHEWRKKNRREPAGEARSSQ